MVASETIFITETFIIRSISPTLDHRVIAVGLTEWFVYETKEKKRNNEKLKFVNFKLDFVGKFELCDHTWYFKVIPLKKKLK